MRPLILVCVLLAVEASFALDSGRCKFPTHPDNQKMIDRLPDHFVGTTFSTSGGGFNFTVGICADVNGNTDTSKCDSAMQTDKDGKKFVLGRCTNTELRAGNDWVMIQYENGDKYAHACDQQSRRTIIMVTCNCSAGEGVLSFFEEDLSRSNESCYYMFELDTSHICKDNCSAVVPPTTTPAFLPAIIAQHGLSGGSIFLIIFFTLLATYLSVGFLVKFCSGHYGLELIPNLYFWMNFFALVADGCDFVFRCGPYAESRLRIDGDFSGDTGYGHTSSSTRRGPLTPPPSALPPSTPALSEASSGYQNFNSLKHQRPVSTTGSLTGEAGSLTGTSSADDTYLIQA